MDVSPVVRKKVKGPQPSTSQHRSNVHRRPPPLPAKPSSSSHPSGGTSSTLPIKNIQGVRTRRTDSTKDGWERDVVFVTRNTPLGALMGRCRSLIMVEGYTRIRLHAMAAAIPHAILLLHALLDILPYPRGDKGMWYEIRTGSTECIDEVRPSRSTKGKEKAVDVQGDVQMDSTKEADTAGAVQQLGELEPELDFEGIGAVEEDEPERRARLKSSIEIDLHIGPKRSKSLPVPGQPVGADDNAGQQKRLAGPPTIGKRNRPSKRKREVLRRTHNQADKAGEAAIEEDDEEAAINMMGGGVPAQQNVKARKQAQVGSAGKLSQVPGAKGRIQRAVESEDEEEEELENQ